jgi:hypothetical protein
MGILSKLFSITFYIFEADAFASMFFIDNSLCTIMSMSHRQQGGDRQQK